MFFSHMYKIGQHFGIYVIPAPSTPSLHMVQIETGEGPAYSA